MVDAFLQSCACCRKCLRHASKGGVNSFSERGKLPGIFLARLPSIQSDEGDIDRVLIEDEFVDCMVAVRN